MRILLQFQTLCLLASLVFAQTQQQICVQKPGKRVDLCVAFTSHINGSSGDRDLHLSMSAKFHDRAGWIVFGWGEVMDGSLMFTMYPGKEQGDVTIGVRTTFGHQPPHIVQTTNAGPTFDIFDRRADSDGYHSASVICYSCERWAKTQIDLVSTSQAYIWATHPGQKAQTSDPAILLHHHTDYGISHADMSISYFAVEKPADFPRITAERLSTVATHSAMSSGADLTGLAYLHGQLFTATVFIIVLGIVWIRSGHGRSYLLHVSMQCIAVLMAALGSLIGLKMSFASPAYRSCTSPHQIIGLILVFTLPLQMFLGYRHHVRFLAIGARTTVSHIHIWLGRVLLTGLNVNLWLGLRLAAASQHIFTWFYVALSVQILVFTFMSYILGKRTERSEDRKSANAEASNGDNAEREVFLVENPRESEIRLEAL